MDKITDPQKSIYQRLEKDVTWEQIQEIMKPRLQILQDGLQKLPTASKKTYSTGELERIRKIIFPHTLNILQILKTEPFLYRTPLRNRRDVKTKQFETSINWLFGNRFIELQQCFTGKTRPADFFPLTEKAHDLLETALNRRWPTPRMFKHTYYVMRMEESKKAEGYDPKREYCPPGINETMTTQNAGRTIVVRQRIDLYSFEKGIKNAYEVTLSLKNLIFNVYKCFQNMGMDELHIVCEPDTIEKAQRRVEGSALWQRIKDKHGDHIHYRDIREFL